MIMGQKVLGIITARGGSKGVPGKNIRVLGGKPLIAWTIEAGKTSSHIDRLILSSDDEAIIKVAIQHGCEVPFKREAHLAADNTPSIDVVLDALRHCPGYDWIVLLQPTSPLRSAADIDGCIHLCVEKAVNSCVSVSEAEESPYWMFRLDSQNAMQPLFPSEQIISRRQDLPSVFAVNGAVYVARTEWLKHSRSFIAADTLAYPMPKERSIDIDTLLDFEMADFFMSRLP